jgi:hypothetical protein
MPPDELCIERNAWAIEGIFAGERVWVKAGPERGIYRTGTGPVRDPFDKENSVTPRGA